MATHPRRKASAQEERIKPNALVVGALTYSGVGRNWFSWNLFHDGFREVYVGHPIIKEAGIRFDPIHGNSIILRDLSIDFVNIYGVLEKIQGKDKFRFDAMSAEGWFEHCYRKEITEELDKSLKSLGTDLKNLPRRFY